MAMPGIRSHPPPYPSDALTESCLDPLAEALRSWFLNNRLDPYGNRKPEPIWTCFEAAQIHNAFIVGLREQAWSCLDGMLREEGDRLVRGLGVPSAWMKPGTRFGVKDMPTELGQVSYTVSVGEDGVPDLAYSGPRTYRLALE